MNDLYSHNSTEGQEPSERVESWAGRARFLTLVLVFSGVLNVGLLTALGYSLWQQWHGLAVPTSSPGASRLAKEWTNSEVLGEFLTKESGELLSLLQDRTLVEEGLTCRDLALACLVSFHHFHLERALGALPRQRRTLPISSLDDGQTMLLTVFPGLSEEQFTAVVQFAQMEKWPWNPEGMFQRLAGGQGDSSLFEAFSTTNEFYSVMTLFARTGLNIDKRILISMLLEGGWDLLARWAQEPLSPSELLWQKRREFLIAYLDRGSRIAARILIETDAEAVVKKLEDRQVAIILQQLSTHTPNFEKFLKALLLSPRSDEVWQGAAARLYEFAGEMVPAGAYDHAVTLARFLPSTRTIAPAPRLAASPPVPYQSEQPRHAPAAARRTHLVRDGDSLWKIAKLYGVTIDALMDENNLDSERLRPGRELLIPGQ